MCEHHHSSIIFLILMCNFWGYYNYYNYLSLNAVNILNTLCFIAIDQIHIKSIQTEKSKVLRGPKQK